MSEKAHWDQVWQNKPAEQTSWFQTAPALSGDFITRAGIAKSDPIIDIGSGASCLIDWMIAARYSNITALDIAAGGILKTKKRLGLMERGCLLLRQHFHFNCGLIHFLTYQILI